MRIRALRVTGPSRRGVPARLLTLYVQPGFFAVTEQAGIVGDPVIAQLLTQVGEVIVVGVRQRVGEIHLAKAEQAELRIRLDDLLAQTGQRHSHFDGGARLEAAAKRQFLVDHGKDAAIGRVHYHYRAVVIPQGLHGGAAHVQILAIHIVALGGIGESRLRPRASRHIGAGEGGRGGARHRRHYRPNHRPRYGNRLHRGSCGRPVANRRMAGRVYAPAGSLPHRLGAATKSGNQKKEKHPIPGPE